MSLSTSQAPSSYYTCPNASSRTGSSNATKIEPRVPVTGEPPLLEVQPELEPTRPFSWALSSRDCMHHVKPQMESLVATVGAEDSTRPFTETSSSQSEAMASKKEPEAKKPEKKTTHPVPPAIDEITALLADACESLPGGRLVFASPEFPEDMAADYSIIRLAPAIEGRVTYGVLQKTQNVDFVIKLPFNRRSTPTQVECQIVYDPGSDRCILMNQTFSTICLTYLSSCPPARSFITKKGGLIIRPGMWRISVGGDADDPNERHLAELVLLRRQFTVAIHKAKDQPQIKRAANDSAGEQSAKRLKLDHDAADIGVAQPTTKSTAQSDTTSTDTNQTESHHMSSFSSARDIVNETSVPLLDLADRETAIIQITAATTTAAYQLQRIKHMGATPSTSVFMCRHSAIAKPVVAKVLRYNGDSARKLVRFAELWKREKLMLEKLKHQYIVSLQAFDGRMLTMYLEPLPSSLFRGIWSTLQTSDALAILHNTSAALAYLHAQQILHNDIKPLNITYSPRRGAVLIDFGTATPLVNTGAGGTPWYLPPEIKDEEIRSPAGDIWALGVTMLYVLGKIEFPESGGRGWPIHCLTTPGDPQAQMNEWLHLVACRRDELNQVDKAHQRQKIEYLVFNMLEPQKTLRIQAGSIVSVLDASRNLD